MFWCCPLTLQIFDNIEPPLQILLNCLKPKAKLIIQGSFNDYPVDVITRYRTVKPEYSEWQSGWNLFSRNSYEKVLDNSNNLLKYRWYDFHMPFALHKTEDVMRSWTIKTEDNNYQQTNGLSQLVTKKILVIDKN